MEISVYLFIFAGLLSKSVLSVRVAASPLAIAARDFTVLPPAWTMGVFGQWGTTTKGRHP